MKFFIGKDEVNCTEEELSMQILNHGLEADVYRIYGKAVKIYKPRCIKTRLDEDMANYLKNIPTKRILMPQEMVYDENNCFNGYTTKLVKEASKETIGKIKMPKMLEEMNLLKEDTKLLTKSGIRLSDLRLVDVLYGDGIYYCDPGSFIKEDIDEKELSYENRDSINQLLIDDIIGVYCKLNKKQKNVLKEMVLSGDYLSDMFGYGDFSENETLTHFIKRITK